MPKTRSLLSTLRLGFTLAEARFRIRNAGSYLGIFWYLLEPLVFFIIIILIQGNLGIKPIENYQAYVLLGLIMVNFFVNAMTGAIRSIRDNRYLVKSINLDLEALPLSVVIQFCFSHFFEFLLFIIFILYYHSFSWTIIFYPLIFIVFAIFMIGLAFIAASLGAFIEDFDNIWIVFSRVLWLATPIFYALTPGTFLYKINLFNPLYYLINIGRQIVIYDSFPGFTPILTTLVLSFATFGLGRGIFARSKKKFIEFL
ncbi:MAG TPA: ABC transporter permease [Candidatus Paceibacterota bacterium]|nr:ABC transporter permease [Candidatus Paceibacterota bacterium]